MRRFTLLALCFGLLTTPALAQTTAQIQKLNDQWMAAFTRANPSPSGRRPSLHSRILITGKDWSAKLAKTASSQKGLYDVQYSGWVAATSQPYIISLKVWLGCAP